MKCFRDECPLFMPIVEVALVQYQYLRTYVAALGKKYNDEVYLCDCHTYIATVCYG